MALRHIRVEKYKASAAATRAETKRLFGVAADLVIWFYNCAWCDLLGGWINKTGVGTGRQHIPEATAQKLGRRRQPINVRIGRLLWFTEYGTGFIARITLGDVDPIFGNGFD